MKNIKKKISYHKFLSNAVILISIFSMNICFAKHIFLELNNILFNIDENIWAFSVVSEEKIKYYKDIFFSIVTQLNPPVSQYIKHEKDSPHGIYYQDRKLPFFINSYYKQHLSEKDLSIIIKNAEENIDILVDNNKNLWLIEKPLLKKIFKTTFKNLFDPAKEMTMFRPHNNLINLIKIMASNPNNSLYIYSNKVESSISVLVDNFPDVFLYFNKPYFISGTIGHLKSSPEFYEYILEKLKIDPSECYVIDNDPLALNSANRVGMNTLLYNNIKDLQSSLSRWDVL